MDQQHSNKLSSHYDKVYSENDKAFGGGEPEEIVLEAAKLITKGGKIIEFGAGQGRNTLALAERGFAVTALDISEVAVNLMNQAAISRSLSNFEAKVGDARANIDGEYDLVISTFVLHHLKREEATDFIRKIKEHTANGGLNAITAFTVEGDFSKLPNAAGRFYPSLGEMRELYSDWEILHYNEENSKARATKPDGTHMFNIKSEVLARKTKRI